MKKIVFCLLTLCALFAVARADSFTLETETTIAGMNYRSYEQGYQPTVSGDTLTVCLPITSSCVNGKIKATLIMQDQDISPLRPQDMHAWFWPTEGLYSVKLSLKLHSSRVHGDYPATVRIEGADQSGQAVSADFPLIIRIRDGKRSAGELRPAISDLSAQLKIGETSAIRATLTNTSRYEEMTAIQLIVTDADGKILPAGSNKLNLPDLMPGESCEIAYPVAVLPDAAVSLHTLRFQLSYLALEQQACWEESFTLPVSQEIRLEQGGVQLPTTVVQGDLANMSLTLMNMGRGELRNVMVSLSLSQDSVRQSVLVGTIAAGETKQAKITFTPGKDLLGPVEGWAEVRCEDAWGNAESFSLPVSITVQEPLPEAAQVLTAAPEEETDWPLYALAGGCAVLVLALIVQGALLRRRIHHLEEERL